MFSLSCYYMQAIVIGEGRVENSHFSDRYSTSGPCLFLLGNPVAMLTPVVVCLTIRICGTAHRPQHAIGNHHLDLLVPPE